MTGWWILRLHFVPRRMTRGGGVSPETTLSFCAKSRNPVRYDWLVDSATTLRSAQNDERGGVSSETTLSCCAKSQHPVRYDWLVDSATTLRSAQNDERGGVSPETTLSCCAKPQHRNIQHKTTALAVPLRLFSQLIHRLGNIVRYILHKRHAVKHYQ